MAEEIPAGDKAVYAFLEMVALAFAFEGTAALLNGSGWPTAVKSYLAALGFFLAGIKWPSIKSLLGIRGAVVGAFAIITLLNYWFGNPTRKLLVFFFAWWGGSHGRWFDRLIGVSYVIVVLLALALFAGAIKALRQIKEQRPKGFLDYKLDAEIAINGMPRILGRLSKIMNEVGPEIDKHTASLIQAGTTAKQLEVSRRASSSLDKYSKQTRRVGAEYTRTAEKFCGGLTGWSNWIDKTRPNNIDPHFRASMVEFNHNLNTCSQRISGYIEAVMRMKGASRHLDAAAERHVAALLPILEMTLKIRAACAESVRIMDAVN